MSQPKESWGQHHVQSNSHRPCLHCNTVHLETFQKKQLCDRCSNTFSWTDVSIGLNLQLPAYILLTAFRNWASDFQRWHLVPDIPEFTSLSLLFCSCHAKLALTGNLLSFRLMVRLLSDITIKLVRIILDVSPYCFLIYLRHLEPQASYRLCSYTYLYTLLIHTTDAVWSCFHVC